ncbi:ABC transporter substrate-binding protein [Streptomyces lavendulae]|uniref:ABC transporter substrate-binding protein n=1 Tax=Streptomyces lavendulae TaxID=1914 RepID=UPI0036E84156
MERSHRRRQPLGAAAALAALLTACGSPAPAGSGKPAAAVADAGNRTTYPTQAENCGRTVKVDRAPERIVSFFASHTELLLELGLKDRVAGQTWTNQSPPKPAYADAYKSLRILAPGEISREALLAARPDFILDDGEYRFDGRKLPTIDELARLSAPTAVTLDALSYAAAALLLTRLPLAVADRTAADDRPPARRALVGPGSSRAGPPAGSPSADAPRTRRRGGPTDRPAARLPGRAHLAGGRPDHAAT